MKYSTRWQFVVALMIVLSPSVEARAAVDCSNPDNLCTGDPCVIGSVEIGQPCNVDFTPRALVIAGTLTVPTDGAVSFTASTIGVVGGIRSGPPGSSGVTLTATDEITMDGRIRLLGENSGVHLTAGTDVTLAGGITLFSTDSGQAVLDVQAGGMVMSTARVTAHGAKVTLSGPAGVQLGGVMNVGRISDNSLGGLLEVSSSGGGVVLDGVIRLPSRGSLFAFLDAGQVEVSAMGDIVVDGRILGRGRDSGAMVRLESSSGDVTVNGPIVATPSGTVVVEAAGQATLNEPVSVGGEGRTLGGGFGCARIEGASVVVNPMAAVRADAPVSGGLLCFNATGGDLHLAGTFLARATEPEFGNPPGVIEGTATGNLVADGTFRCAPNGCISLQAGGTLDTAGGSFDKPLSADCGYCPTSCP